MKADHHHRRPLLAALLVLGSVGAGLSVVVLDHRTAATSKGSPTSSSSASLRAGSLSVGVRDLLHPPRLPASPVPPAGPHAANLPWQVLVSTVSWVYGKRTVVDGAPVSLGSCASGSVTWIDHRLARFELHPGGSEPGGSGWSEPTYITADRRGGLVATFNGGFKLSDSRGGFYLSGRTAGTLRSGAASEFFGADGSLDVGVYGRDGAAGGSTIGVRQNLDLLVDGGVASSSTYSLSPWGATFGGATCVRRSGVGVTAAGDLVYATGSSIDPHGLAQLLIAAGAVRAMQLDINPVWPSFMYYQSGVSHLYGDSARSPDRYLSPADRDFVAVYLR